MSNPVAETNEVIAAVGETTAEPAKKGIIGKVIDSTRRTYLKIRSTKGGRIVIRGSKAALIGLGLYESYKLGQKSVTPTVVTITEGVSEDAPVEEPMAEEADENPVEETENE